MTGIILVNGELMLGSIDHDGAYESGQTHWSSKAFGKRLEKQGIAKAVTTVTIESLSCNTRVLNRVFKTFNSQID